MSGNMSFDYDAEHDLVAVRFRGCVLNNALDVARWRTELEGHLSRFRCKVDLLVDLDGLRVRYPAGRAYGRERAHVLARYSRLSYRYGGDEMTRMFINTSGAISGAATNVFGSREAALTALLAERKLGLARGARVSASR